MLRWPLPPPPGPPRKTMKNHATSYATMRCIPASNFVFDDTKLMSICEVYVCEVTRSNNLPCVFLAKVK